MKGAYLGVQKEGVQQPRWQIKQREKGSHP